MARSKFYNRKTVVDGITFDSKAEAARYAQLKVEAEQGQITDLQLQVKFDLVPSARRNDGKLERAAAYIADFVYTRAGVQIVEDVKSSATAKEAVYILKRKLMLHIHGITVVEIL